MVIEGMPATGAHRGTVFLDRDGTLIEDIGFLSRVDQVAFFPWTIDAIRVLNRAGLTTVVVTNQSGVARGHFDLASVEAVHTHIAAVLAAGGARIDAYYYCPHHPDGSVAEFTRVCTCRKPARGLVDQAGRDLGVDPERSFVVGDRWSDVALARAIGGRGLLVRTGYGSVEEPNPPGALAADIIADNLIGAVGWILMSLMAEDGAWSAC